MVNLTITEKLAAALKVSNATTIMKSFKEADGTNDFTYFMAGADYEINRLATLHLALVECVKSLDTIQKRTFVPYEEATSALANLEKVIGEMK